MRRYASCSRRSKARSPHSVHTCRLGGDGRLIEPRTTIDAAQAAIDLQNYHHYIGFQSNPNAKQNFRRKRQRGRTGVPHRAVTSCRA